jgi:hypothetical protein
MKFTLRGAGHSRTRDADSITASVRYLNSSPHYKSASVSDSELAYLLAVNQELNTATEQHKRITCYDSMQIYTNDSALLERVRLLNTATDAKYHQAIIDRPLNVLIRKQNKYQYRTYFKSVNVSPDASTRVKKFLLDRTDCFKFTPSFKYYLTSYGKMYFRDYFFVDHNSMSEITMLSLVCPGIVRKTMPIQTK